MTSPFPAPTLVLYVREGCHLCEDGRAAVQGVLEHRAESGLTVPAVREVDIAADPVLEARYGTTIPVLALGGEELPLATGARSIRGFLSRVLDLHRATA